MWNTLFRKIFVLCIILLFIGTGFIPSMNKQLVSSVPIVTPNLKIKSLYEESNQIVNKGLSEPFSLYLGITFYVGGGGPGNYSSIQDAIDNTTVGDTVFVYDDSSPYYENIVVDNSIQLIGEKRESTVIDGGGSGNVLTIIANFVRINNFSIKNGGGGNAGIKILSSSNSSISNCTVHNNFNTGIELISSFNNTITNCNISNNDLYGIIIDASSNNSVKCCTVYQHNFGIDLDSSSDNNIFYHNSILNNNLSAYDPSDNTWDDGYPSGGNYWSDYIGLDNFSGPNQNIPGSDHIGDTPYNIMGGVYQDRYPLMASFGFPHAHFLFTINDMMVFFNASLSFDYDGTIDWYVWDFGDGNTSTDKNSTYNYNYADYGVYNVTLTVIDDDNRNDSVIKTIIVDNDPPVIKDNTADEAVAGSPFTFNATVTDNVSDVSEVWVEYWYDSGEHYNLSMENIAGNDWEKKINISLANDILHYILSAVDTAGNWVNTNQKNVNITPNKTPNIPQDPIPQNGKIDVDIDTDLNWTGGDSDPGDIVTYEIYFGTTSSPSYKETIGPFPGNQTSISYNIDPLDYNTKYYWKIISYDGHGASAEGPVWNFNTIITKKINVRITKPKDNIFYFKDKYQIPLPKNVIIVGPINITADVTATGEIDRVEFYVDGKKKGNDVTEEPYIYNWNPFISFRTSPTSFNHTLKVIAYDTDGNFDSDEIIVWKWRMHPVLILVGSYVLIRLFTSLFRFRLFR